jgi:DNA repair protein RadC
MKAVAPHDRPREKLERHGASALGDNELLALVLGSGSRHADALDLANALIGDAGGLHHLTRKRLGDLRRVPGIGYARAAQVLAALELGRRTLIGETEARPRLATPAHAAAHLLPLYGAHPVEQFGIVMLDNKSRVIAIKIIAVGSIDSAVVHPREVFREAISVSAYSVILFHNHPSGDPSPSEDDVAVTTRMVAAGELVGISVVDHVILADQRYFSMHESTVGRPGAE